MKQAQALVLVGPMGAGKSVVGARVARRLGWRFIDVDAQVEQGCGLSIAGIFGAHGEDEFRRLECAALRDALGAGDVVVATGGGAVLDPGNRIAMRDAAWVVHLHADIDAQLQRLHGDVARPLLAGEDRIARLQALAAVREPLYADVAQVRIDTSSLAPDVVADVVLDAFAEHAHD